VNQQLQNFNHIFHAHVSSHLSQCKVMEQAVSVSWRFLWNFAKYKRVQCSCLSSVYIDNLFRLGDKVFCLCLLHVRMECVKYTGMWFHLMSN